MSAIDLIAGLLDFLGAPRLYAALLIGGVIAVAAFYFLPSHRLAVTVAGTSMGIAVVVGAWLEVRAIKR
jgi:hypothetical protein